MSDEEEVKEAMESSDSSDESSSDEGNSSNTDEGGDDEDADQADISSEDDIVLGDDWEKLIEDLELDVQRSPILYDKHVELIGLYRKTKQNKPLEEARERMHIHFPLSPKLWTSWLKDVQRNDKTKENKDKILSLFKRAVQDYQSVDLWLDYCTFAVGSMEAYGGKWVRSVFEEALSHVGGHVSKGGQVWAAYRDFEMIQLAQMPRDPNPGKQEAVDGQCETIAKLFRRELSLPLRGMEEVYEEYKDWVTEVPKEVKDNFERAKNNLSEIEPLIDAIEDAESDEEMYRTHVEYINFCERKGIPSRIICGYEEALTALCLRADLWQRYLKYLIKFFLTEASILPHCRRAVRNCPWSLELWLLELECMERFEKDKATIRESFENALQAGFTEGVQFLSLWTAYACYLRRQIDWSASINELQKSKDVEALRDTLERAIIQLEKYFNKYGDPNCQIFRFWAFIEAKHMKNLPKARELWSEVMKRNHGNEAHMWLDYINFERAYGDTKHCRKVLARAINSVTDWPEQVFEACLRFEREEGTFESLIEVRNKIEQQRARLTERWTMAEAKEKAAKVTAQGERSARRGQKRSSDSASINKPVKKANLETTTPKKIKAEVMDVDPVESRTDSDGFVVPNAPSHAGGAKVAPPPGYLAHKARLTIKPETTESESDTIVKDITTPIAIDAEAEKTSRTVFVSNLNFNTKEASFRNIFEKCGEVVDVRLVRDKQGRSRGYAYVEFKTKDPIKEALQLDRTPIDGRPMFVSECNAKKRHTFQYAGGLEKNKLFIRNLPKTITQQALETMFSKYGTVTGVRLATYRNGSFKGHAYVDFQTDSEASKAVVGADGQMVGDCMISVNLSNPPRRKEQQEFQASSTEFEPSLGGGKRVTSDHGKARTQISLLPRSLVKKSGDSSTLKPPEKNSTSSVSGSSTNQDNDANASTSNGSENPQAIAKNAAMSNADFRQMFLKK